MAVNPASQAAQAYVEPYGVVVTGGAKTLPTSATGHLFTVAGGRVVITSITGVVSTVVQAQACTISVGNTPTGGSGANTSLATASASVSGLAAGASLYALVFSSGAQALQLTGASGVFPTFGVPLSSGGIAVVPAGTIDWTTSATNTGAVTWTVSYVAYDSGATVAAL